MFKTIGKRRVYINIINIMESLCGNKRETICKDDCSSEYSLFIATYEPPYNAEDHLKKKVPQTVVTSAFATAAPLVLRQAEPLVLTTCMCSTV